MEMKIQFNLETGRNEVEAEEAVAANTAKYDILSIQSVEESRVPALAEARFVDPVTIVIASTLAVLATRLVDYWLRGTEQGVLIDLREQPLLISRLAGIPFGFLVIIDKKGKATSHQAEYSDPADIAPLLNTIFAEASA